MTSIFYFEPRSPPVAVAHFFFVRSMRAQLLLASLLLSGMRGHSFACPTDENNWPVRVFSLRGTTFSRYSNSPPRARTLAEQLAPRCGSSPNRVRVESGHPIHSGWSGIAFFAVRHHGTWYVDDHTRLEGVAEGTFVTYLV